jgi:heme exporter protein A
MSTSHSLSTSTSPHTRVLATLPAIDVRGVQKHLGGRAVLRGIDLQVLPGRTLAVVGPNGAGKTTLLRVLATLMRPSAGAVHLCGIDALADPVAARRHLGVVFGSTFLYAELTGAENLRYYARLYGVPADGQRLAELATMVGLAGRLDQRAGTYSRGMAQRLSLARALLHDPGVLLLDEPDAGLDPLVRSELSGLLRGDRSIVVTTHDLHLALTLADNLAILANGRFVFAAPTTSLTLETFGSVYADACRAAARARGER